MAQVLGEGVQRLDEVDLDVEPEPTLPVVAPRVSLPIVGNVAAPGTKAVVSVTLAGKAPEQARFTPMAAGGAGVLCAEAAMLRWLITTPLGTPVLPEV